ncbi:MAG: hypothetical protein A2W17_08955 [Planctomycetes bacterium RBG_16_41_13]|nr:MAG: hypothetical protein A2W17_08955 [Planctomycetes bacterium RBG_16_41_13]
MKYQKKFQELDQASILLNLLNLRDGKCIEVSEIKETPDFILNDQSGLEVTQVINRNLKHSNSFNDELRTAIEKALYSEKLSESYQVDIYIADRKIFFSKNRQETIIKCIINSVKGQQINLSKCGIEEINKKTISSNYNSQRYLVDLFEKNPDKKSRLVARGIKAFYYIKKPGPLTQDIQSAIKEKVKKYLKMNLSFKRLLVYIPNEADYLLSSTEIFREGCEAINNTWKDVFEETYCAVSMYDIEYGDHASKRDEYVIYDFQNKNIYVMNNEKRQLLK